MTKNEAVERFASSGLLESWHWFGYHFHFYTVGAEHPFARSIVEACLACEGHLPGFTERFARRFGAISGRERDHSDYEQLLQALAELLVVRHVVTSAWPGGTRFEMEPTTSESPKNPELGVYTADFDLLVEVKAPALLQHQEHRGTNPVQIPARTELLGTLRDRAAPPGSEVTLPRDNPVKDFLLSAESKFKPFKGVSRERPVYTLLAIVWDDHIYEPLSSLTAPQSGLFTDQSFARDDGGTALPFSAVDSVVLIRHLHQFVRASKELPTVDSIQHSLDYGHDGEFPPKALVQNPHGQTVPEPISRVFQAYPWDSLMGAEYVPADLVWWL